MPSEIMFCSFFEENTLFAYRCFYFFGGGGDQNTQRIVNQKSPVTFTFLRHVIEQFVCLAKVLS